MHSILTSLSYKYIKTWHFHGQCKAGGLGTNKISYIFDLRHVSKVVARFQKKNKIFIYLFKYPNEERVRYLKNEVAQSYLEPCQISITERFCIIDV